MKIRVLAVLAATAILSIVADAAAQAVKGSDYSSDGYSDIMLISIQGDDSLAWSAYTASGVAIPQMSITAGVAGNHLAIANWASTTIAQRGFISLGAEAALWTVIPETGAAVSRELGGTKDSLISGGDFNGNGYADAAFVKKPLEAETTYRWQIRPDFFRDAAGGPRSKAKAIKVNFGKVGGSFFYVNVLGQNDWLAVLSANPSGPGSLVQLKNPLDGKSREFRVTGFSYANIRPLPIRQKKKRPDLLALAERSAGSTLVTFVDMRGRVKRQVTLPGEGELIVGNFLTAPGEELAIQQSDNSFLFYNPITEAQSSVALPTGIPIDDININSFDSNPVEPSCEDETLSPNDGTDRFLWKPKGENSGLLRVLFPQIWTGKITQVVLIHPSTQAIIESAALSYDASNPNARTFAMFRKPGGKYPENVTVRARLVAGCYKSYVIPHPSERTD
ncbi:MAG: hypothetical protein J0M12_02050 [Deltaproteobacteria bacterium]|nr:hypothetical protein [Deltaproteobacteria bacterium]